MLATWFLRAMKGVLNGDRVGFRAVHIFLRSSNLCNLVQFGRVLEHIWIVYRIEILHKSHKKNVCDKKVTGKKWRELPLGGFPIRIQKTCNHSPYVDRHYFLMFYC